MIVVVVVVVVVVANLVIFDHVENECETVPRHVREHYVPLVSKPTLKRSVRVKTFVAVCEWPLQIASGL
jgi:hypothetical protein